MSSTIAVFERLLDDDSVTAREHVLESASPHVAKVQDRLEQNFDSIVKEVSLIWGEPEFHGNVPEPEPPSEGDSEQKKARPNTIPAWCQGTARNGGASKALRVCYWKRPHATNYIVLRTEIDSKKNRPIDYSIVLGARRRTGTVDVKAVAALRQQKNHWMSGLLTCVHRLLGR